MPKEDLTNKLFGSWLVLEYAGDSKWLCECQCELHTRRAVLASSLKRHASTSCGNRKMHPKNNSLVGTEVGELKVIEYLGNSIYECKCSCGKVIQVETKQLKRESITDCGHIALLKRQQILKEQRTQKMKPRYKPAGDWTVLEPTKDSRYYVCKCVCGYKKIMSNSSIYNARIKNYKCKHTKIIHKRFGDLEVLERKTQKECLCKCHACGKITTVLLGNLLNGTSTTCGCSKAPTYTKKQLLQIINSYTIKHNGVKPQPLELKELTNLGETAIYENIKRYGLESYLDRYSSIGEKQVAELFNGQNIIRHDRKILRGMELDIYLPDLKLAIEYNGSFWHSDERKDKLYHQNKTLSCAKQGIQLIHIFDYEWEDTDKRKKLTDYLNSYTKKCEIYYARNLIVQEVSNKNANDFCDKYHLQNHVNSSISIALIKDSEIISIMQFNEPRFNHKYQYELTRYCNKSGIKIVGGAAKMFKYFIDKYSPQSIITYTDISKFTGNVYTRIGFEPIKGDTFTIPNYVWVDRHLTDILPRYKTQKHKLVEKKLGTIEQTEDEIMESLGYIKVYDSGNLKLEWYNNST